MSGEAIRDRLSTVRALVAMMSSDNQDDVESIARSFRNILSIGGKPALLAFSLVAAEVALKIEAGEKL